MTAPRFTSFVMFAAMRTGSNFLEANLNALEGVSCLGEMFNPHFIGKKDRSEAFGIDLEARAQNPKKLLRKLRAETPGLAGFRYFHDHEPKILEDLLSDPGCAKVILTRNPLESYVSLKIAQATGQWKLTNLKNLKTAKARFEGDEFLRHVERAQDFQLRLMQALQSSGQTAFYIDYEDISDLAVLNGLAAWLGVPARLEAVDQTLKKQNPGRLEDKVENPEAIPAALARLDRFNLGRSPNFEPRRAPMIPSFLAAADAPLLYLPLRGGPVGQVSTWLGALGRGGLHSDFVQKTLRQWKSDHPGHRSFTVIRHPLLRAHQAFLSQLVSGKQSEIRQLISRSYGASLPPPGRDFADKGQHQAAFLAFLRFARHAAAGQTGGRIDGHWASQSAVIQGFATFQPPDLILREEQLPEGLGWLCAGLGISAPALNPDPEPAAALNAIWSPELEQAAEEAWPRDYMGFGYGRWRRG
ncbi:nodulation protein NodH [Pseudogemmobacter faecipullorum]|uniref:Nodulation protein NodH n=1 Tax=Pseudogemmobacter faecipullorum TaxID=2755041 RepID=A0ABS8CHJ0_9RHOB|nr:nodulation protein NodH [Pseudogemmobacter faecipullorum]MCB5408856.1 nodulation protein NodH [Pseudogemmobacter faecipullorum]